MRNLVILFAAVAAGCGGGGGNPGTCSGSDQLCNPPPPAPSFPTPAPSPSPAPAPSPSPSPTPAPPPAEQPANTAEGFWHGASSNGRTTTTIVQDDGVVWTIYSAVNNPGLIGGVIHGHITRAGDTILAGDARDFNLEGLGVNDATVTATFVAQSTISGTIRYTNTTLNFGGTFDAKYLQKPSLASLAGTYVTQSVIAGNVERVTATVTADGKMTGSGTSGCSFSGTAAPRISGNIFATKLTFNGPPCILGNQTTDGVLYFDETIGRAYGAGLNGSRTGGLLYIAQRQ